VTPEERLSPERVLVLRRRASWAAIGVGVPVAVVMLGLAVATGDLWFVVPGAGTAAMLGGMAGSLAVMPTQLDTLRWSLTIPGLDRRRARQAARAMTAGEPRRVAAADLPVVLRSARMRLRLYRLFWPSVLLLTGAAVTQLPALVGPEPAPGWRRLLALLAWVLVAFITVVVTRERRGLERFLAGVDEDDSTR
jgi:hypothetical protein